jgi:TusA-related sulfurtransferase
LLKAKQALARLKAGQVLEIMATDAGSWRDFETFADNSIHELLQREERGEVYHYWLRKGEELAS